ncbi:PilZ domain-containing protein [Salinarimonas rosea]|uniref:PilZ domain-containing protein n=1 Tax=Salinarimonas rosea TaxID=552063 RepID=UPI00040EEBD9|nr:PilZ domain-containing protein [Salinarimonas rosea]
MSTFAETSEQRTAPRRRALVAARIRYGGGAVTVDCVVRNISDTGAKIDLSEGVTLPEHFEIVIPQMNAVHRAELRWRRGSEAGIAFLDAAEGEHRADAGPLAQASTAPTPSEAALKARIRALEAEVVRLRERILELGGGL